MQEPNKEFCELIEASAKRAQFYLLEEAHQAMSQKREALQTKHLRQRQILQEYQNALRLPGIAFSSNLNQSASIKPKLIKSNAARPKAASIGMALSQQTSSLVSKMIALQDERRASSSSANPLSTSECLPLD